MLNSQQIIKILQESRPAYDENESWEGLENLGLEGEYKKKLGQIIVVQKSSSPDSDYYGEETVVWYFKDHDVYLKGSVSGGSYGVGYRLDVWELKEVYPRTIEVTIYE